MSAPSGDILQKVVTPWVSKAFYNQGYYHLGGPVSRAVDVAALTTPAQILDAWGLRYDGSPFGDDPEFVDVLRFRAHPLMALTNPFDAPQRPWPTYSNGFLSGAGVGAPVWTLDRTRVPAGAELWRVERDGQQRFLTVFTGPARGWADSRGYFPPIHLVGTRAKWRDLDVPADLVGDGNSVELAVVGDTAPEGFEQVRVGVWSREVPRDDVSELFEVIITATYRDVQCRIIQHTPIESRILLLTDDPDTVSALNVQEADIGVFEATVPTAELSDIAGQSRHAGSVAAAASTS
jgi:hypothetical protein